MIPFVGPSYQLKLKRQGVQRSINLMPTPIEGGNGKAPAYLKPIPGLVLFSTTPDDGGGELPDAGPFTAAYYSDSCNYGFFPLGADGSNGSAGGGFLLVTDTLGTEVHPDYGFYLKLVVYDASGEILSETVSDEYCSETAMATYDHGGFVYVGAVDEIATGHRAIVKINKTTLAVSMVATLDTDLWRAFMPLADPDLVIINTEVVGAADTFTHKVVDLTTGSVVKTIDLPGEFGNALLGNVAQSTASGDLMVAAFNTLYVVDYSDGSVIGSYTGPDLGISTWSPLIVQEHGGSIVVYAHSTATGTGKLGVFNESTEVLDGVITGLGPRQFNAPTAPVDRYVYRASDQTIFFVDMKTTTATLMGYSLDTLSTVYTLEVGMPANDYGSGSYVGSVDDNDVAYVSVFFERTTIDGGNAEGYIVYAIPP